MSVNLADAISIVNNLIGHHRLTIKSVCRAAAADLSGGNYIAHDEIAQQTLWGRRYSDTACGVTCCFQI